MDINEYKLRGMEMINYICNYYETIRERRVFPAVKPGYLAPLLPKEAPKVPDKWEDIMKDVETKIMPGITHWNHPRFFAYFPAGNSFASFLGDMLSDGIGCIGFSWASSPACTELETIVLDWFGKALNIPDFFLYSTPGSVGGGVIQGSASECVLVCMLAAREDAITHLKESDSRSDRERSDYLSRLVCYVSTEAHSCFEKAAKICMVKIRMLKPDNECSLRGPTLAEAIQKDLQLGLHPFYVGCTLGSTGCCGFDNLKEIGPIVAKLNHCWMHVDAAYAGSSFICPELRYLKDGLEFADSFNTNCNKFLNVTYDCSCMWVKERKKLITALVVDPLYLHYEQENVTISYRHWMIPLSRRFRSLKLWFTLRNYGIAKLQSYIRNHITLAQAFEELVRKDDRFEVCNVVRLGLVCFRLKAPDKVNQELLAAINGEGTLHMVPAMVNDKFILRFCVIYEHSKLSDIEYAWNVIQHHGSEILKTQSNKTVARVDIEFNRRMSYLQTVPPDVFAQLSGRRMLRSEDSPILIPDTDIEALSIVSGGLLDDDDS